MARAGNDQSLTLPVANIELNGSGSYVSNGGTITGYQWTQVSGPNAVSFSNANTALAQANNITEGRYLFALTVTDNSNTQRSDTVLIVVSSRILIDFGPDASGTPDANGRFWNNIADGRPGVKLSNAISTGNTATTIGLEIINRIDGTFNVNGPGTNTGNSTGTVQDYPASATTDFAFAEPSATNGQWKITGLESTKQYTIKFWGTRSVSDNRIIQIMRADQSIWQEYNAAGNSNYENAATFTFYGKSQMTFDIRVKNGSAFGYISLIDIVKTTPAQTTNIAPVAQASDVNVAIPATSATLNGSASYDDDGTLVSYQWTQTSGPNTAEIVSSNTAITAINNLEEGIYTFRLQVTDDSSAVASTTITVTVNRRVLIDFGATLTNGADASGKYWNNVTNGLPGIKLEDAVTTGNSSSGIAFEIINRIDGTFNPAGPGVNTGLIGTDVGDYPNSSVVDYVFAHNSASNGQWKLSGLDSTKQYVVKFWGTRDASDERTILIKPSDATVWQQYDARNNTDYNNAAVFTFVGKTERTFDIKVSDNSTFGHISLVDIRITNPPVDCRPTIEIVVDKKEAVCAGTAVTFTATATHLGTQPVYEWRRNGVAVPNVSGNVYTASDFNNGDVVNCKITSNTLCVYGDTAVSNEIPVAVLAPVVLGSISGPTDACPLIGGSAIYSVPAAANVSVYSWTAPAGTSIISGQGTNSIELGFNNGFGSSAVLTVVGGSCSNPVTSTIAIVKNIPANPGAITGPNNACGFAGTSNLATYSIAPVANATSYIWTVPAGAQISSGQGSTSIQVQFSTAYTAGNITVAATSNCYTS
ncbi:MAG TPA: PKD domain-containing protein, partial [Ferruginibacter sp.]|nr:PKD domain-containing protein [Ferruginibacter sp.]